MLGLKLNHVSKRDHWWQKKVKPVDTNNTQMFYVTADCNSTHAWVPEYKFALFREY